LTTDLFDPTCHSCQAERGIVSLTNAPVILRTEHWRVEHAHPTSVLGWLVVVLRRHRPALHNLTSDEWQQFSTLLPVLCQALHQTLGTEKEYVMQFAEHPRAQHVHFHVVARLPDWPEHLRGSYVFDALGSKIHNPLPSETTTPFALQLRTHLLQHLPPNWTFP
jgi:diadenosine tetraphosphate (Ap4A) HIT family hydrolase